MRKVYFLIVDDDALVTKSYMRIVGRYFLECGRSIETIVVHSGPEAIKSVELILAIEPEAEWGLLTDYDMPLMTGAVLIDRLDERLGTKLIWRLVLTGALDDARKAEIEAKQAFVDEKPVHKKDLESYLYTFITSLA